MTTREKIIQIFNAGVAAVQPSQLIPSQLFINHGRLHIFDESFLIKELPNIYIIGAGKASAAMAITVEAILGHLVTEGMVVTKYAHALPMQKIICLEADHPIPDKKGVAATEKTIQLLQKAGKNDIVICLISGGASSLWIDVPDGITLTDIQETFQLLIKCGASIDEVNTIRKHLSSIKGGQLLQYAPTAHWFSLILSDVPGDDLSVIASGPTVPDNTTFFDVQFILEKYNLGGLLPGAILQHFADGLKGIVKETPGENDPVFGRVHNRIIGSNRIALEAAATKAKELGYHIPFIVYDLSGDAAIMGSELMYTCNKYTGTKPACFLLGGETTVKVTGKGKGGRNQQLVLSFLIALAAQQDLAVANQITLLSAGSDGTDGPTDAAGAIADRQGLTMAKEKQLDLIKYFNDNDAYHFFEQTGGLLKTGATQTNVMDLVVIIID